MNKLNFLNISIGNENAQHSFRKFVMYNNIIIENLFSAFSNTIGFLFGFGFLFTDIITINNISSVIFRNQIKFNHESIQKICGGSI